MPRAYYSIVIDRSADAIWATIRPFGHYAWAGVESETTIEDGKTDDQVGAVRRVIVGENTIRQQLLAHSDLDRSYTYAFCGQAPFPVENYLATIRVLPIVADGDKAFVEWSATFDCALSESARWVTHFERQGFAKWLGALAQFMNKMQNEVSS
jgi:hypothetical protein